MQYNQYAFSKNIGDITISPVNKTVSGNSLGQRLGLSLTDIAQINAAYVSKYVSYMRFTRPEEIQNALKIVNPTRIRVFNFRYVTNCGP